MATGKTYYWIKLNVNFMTSDKVDFLMSQKDGANYIVLYQMLCLKTINNAGELSRKLGEMIIPFDEMKIQRDCKYFSIDTIRVALDLYKRLDMIYINENQMLQIANFNEMVGKETDYAKQKRVQRQEKALELSYDKDSSVDIVHTEYRDKSLDIRDKILDARDKEEDIEPASAKTPRKTFISVINEFTSNDELRETLNSYIAMRKKTKGFTVKALELNLIKLSKMNYEDNQMIEVVNNSIMNSWKGLYELKSNNWNANDKQLKLPKENKVEYDREAVMRRIEASKKGE